MNNTIWQIRIPRTGTSSIGVHLRENPLKHNQLYSYGHNGYSKKINDYLSRNGNLIKIVNLRDPVEHTISLHSYIFHYKAYQENEKNIVNDFSKWVRHYDLEDYFVKFFDEERRDVSWCLNILDDFKVFNTATLKYDFNQFLAEIGEAKSFDLHESNLKGVEISDEDIKYIKNIRSKDYELIMGVNENIISDLY